MKASRMDDRPMIAGVTSQMNPARWREFLGCSNSWDWDSHYILDGMVHGFHMLDRSPSIKSYEIANYDSCFTRNAKKKLSALIREELADQKLSLCQSKPTCVHALGVILKESGGIRPITDCSRPTGNSVNCYTEESFSTFSFVKLDEIFQKVHKGYYLCTVDIKAAYRSILIHPDERQYFGLRWKINGKDQYLQDNCVCFGARMAPGCFTRITDAVVRMMQKDGYVCFCYLDDYICIEPTYERSVESELHLIHLLRRLGFYINWGKTTSPSRCCLYLGMWINTDLMEISLQKRKCGSLDQNWRRLAAMTQSQGKKQDIWRA